MSDNPESSKTQPEEDIIDPLFQKDFLSQLPQEVASRIIVYLTPCDLTVCAGVSRTWQRICEDDRTWRQKCLEKGYVKFDAPSFRFLGSWATNRANEQVGIKIFSHMNLQEAHQNRREREITYGQCYERSPWKSLYLRKKRIISNWLSRAIQSSTVLKGRGDEHISCLQIHSGHIIAGYHSKTLWVWNVDDAEPAFTLTGHIGMFWTSQMSDDGKYIVGGANDGMVRVWCGQTRAQRHVLQGHTSEVYCMSLHGTTLVSGSHDQTLRVWDIVDGKCLHILTGHMAEVCCVQFDGIRVVSGADDFTVKVWNVHTGECLHTLTGHTKPVSKPLLFEPERDLVVSGSHDGTLRVWDVQRGTCIAILLSPGRGWGSGMQLRGNILACYYDSDIFVWDIRDGGSCIHRLQGVNGHTSYITSSQLLESGLLVTASYDGWVKLWDVDKGTFVRDLSGRIVIGYHDNTLRIWNVDDAQPVFTLTGQMGVVKTSQVSDDGKYIVSGLIDRTVRVWCGQTGVQRHVLQGHASMVNCISLHGTTLVSGSYDQTLRVWDIIDGKCLQILTGDLGMVRCVQFDGIRVVSGALDGTVKVWNVQTGECLQTLTGHTRRVDSLLFEPERDLVVSRSLDKTIRVWDIRGGTCIAIPISGESVYRYRHYGMQLRGNSLVACYTGSDVGVWDIRDGGSCIHVHLQGVNGHALNITSLQLLDSGLLITSSEDGSVKLWDVDKGIFVRDLVRLQAGSWISHLEATETFLLCEIESEPGNRTENTELILIDFDASYP
ncbi:unnamed protein product, partial [Mesorhabditis belari]|uniref:F-box domain-containing protein n=1 Tax=Mesorhabditis belari TaxID=2138241 RepID=A0AAF3F3U9_9BILA